MLASKTVSGTRHRRGAILPLIAVTLVGFMALLALAIDGGSIQRHRRLAQIAADAGAQAGAMEIIRSHTDTATVFSAARSDAGKNGYTTGTSGANVIVTTPVSPDHFTGTGYVKVVVEDTVQTTFARIIGRPLVLVRARALGGIIAPSVDCLVSLDPDDDHALSVDAGAVVTAPSCVVRVNSNALDALYVSGSTLNATGGSIKVYGGADVSGGTVSPAVQTPVLPAPDPLGYLAMPTFNHACTYTNAAPPTKVLSTWNPGTYCGGFVVQGGSPTIVELTPGIYYMLGQFQVKNTGTIVRSSGTGVTIVLTCDATHDYGHLDFQSNSTEQLSYWNDPANPLPGAVIYQDPTCPVDHSHANNFQSGANSLFTGNIYFKTQSVEIHSGSDLVINGALVGNNVHVYNNTTVCFGLMVGGVCTHVGGGGSGFFGAQRASIVE